MQTQNSTYTRPRVADFNAAMKRAAPTNETGPRQQAQAGSFSNRNLSSIISRIADDGPANIRPAREANRSAGRRDRRSPQSVPNAPSRSAAVNPPGNEPYAFAQSFSFDDPDIRKNAAQTGGNRNARLQQLVLMVLVAVTGVMGFFLYQLKMQAADMDLALQTSQEQALRTGSPEDRSSDVVPRLNNMNRALADLKQEMLGIKNGYQQSDSKLAVEIPRDLEPRLLEIAAASEIVTVLQDEFERIQDEMHSMGTELQVIKQEMVTPRHPTIDAESIAVPAPAIPNLVVNLASLTSKDKALAAIGKLQAAGISPRMQQVMVNGKIVFRISVDGFTSREAASAFITEARDKFGFDGGWIRQI